MPHKVIPVAIGAKKVIRRITHISMPSTMACAFSCFALFTEGSRLQTEQISFVFEPNGINGMPKM